MSIDINGANIEKLVNLSDSLEDNGQPVAIILAAGHGKRIKSERSKMLHEIWGVTTVVRVAESAAKGLGSENQVIIVGIKANEVAETAGKAQHRIFVLQKEQKGTGDAAWEALNALTGYKNIDDLFILPGDMGLITAEVIAAFKNGFKVSKCGMKILTGIYHGDPSGNTYGRIIRVPAKDKDGHNSGDDFGKVIEIKEHKDILAIPDGYCYIVDYNERSYSFSKDQLLKIDEYNTGIYAVKYNYLKKHIGDITSDNVQGELYLTDIISIFNKNGIAVGADPVDDDNAVIGFNVKSVLKEMDGIYRKKVYEQLRDLIVIEDEDDFFIADEVVEQILALDKQYPSLDIYLQKGVHLSKGVKLNRGVSIWTNTNIRGNVEIGEGTIIQDNVSIRTYPHQQLHIGNNCIIMRGDIIKGNLRIGDNTRIESGVNMTGSDEYPTVIGNNVTIKGTTYIFGSIIEDDIFIEHSVLKSKKVERTLKKDGAIQPVRWVMPQPQGLDIVSDL
ncbi:NTP transferase domain-containing protein [bacterium]|nr:NTP transferase domain-containing protein [bacterium]MBU1063251.1 NTP transferase domain-containing protein [bacterium]MBU1633408.1 NTP transferase domain-containing protein [bacterium]MBU1875305.1 NTP transferase domain-containing protein [bacterium]